MDKNAIKKYAVWARRELIEKVSQKALQYGIEEGKGLDPKLDSINGVLLTEDEKKQRQALIRKINENGYTHVMEEVAYTWFNRFIALRFMEVNGYLPSHVRVFTDEAGEFKPQIMSEALHLELEGLDMEKVYELKNDNRDDDLFKYLLITQCNALSGIFPKMFQKIADYTELLLPDFLLREGSVIEQMVNQKEGIPEADWKDQVQIIGWLYQYYNTEPKDKVFADLKKNVKITKEKIPAATQLFTPDWIVHYMVENSLGRLWLEGHPNNTLKSEWKYYLDEAEQEPDVQKQLDEIRKEYAGLKPEEIKCIDPCMGSGHILCVLFDTLIRIYEDFGHTAREAVIGIINNNLWGLDIDERAAQLSYFTVMMKARQYDRRFLLRKDENGNPNIPQPHVYVIEESNIVDSSSVEYFVDGRSELRSAMSTIVKEMQNAKEYGSIINVTPVDFNALYIRFDELRNMVAPDIFTYHVIDQLLPLVRVAQALAQKYNVLVTNPPYMGSGGMGGILSEYVKKNYPDTKLDLSTVFMDKLMEMSVKDGFVSMINIPVWMFLSSYETLREKLLNNSTIVNMLHLGRGVFGSDFGTTAFVLSKDNVHQFSGIYRRLFKKQGAVDGVETKGKWFLEGYGAFVSKQDDFFRIPGQPIAYWVSEEFKACFENRAISDVAQARLGMATANNDRFLRLWYEVDINRIGFSIKSRDEATKSGQKWFPYNKGGEFRKWYGNRDYVVNWENDGLEVRNFKDEKTGRIRSHNYNLDFIFQKGITWTFLSSSKFSSRFFEEGFLCDAVGCGLYTDPSLINYLEALLCSCVTDYILNVLNPSISYQPGNIGSIPLCIDSNKRQEIEVLTENSIELSRSDWDSFETSWNFMQHPLIGHDVTLKEAFTNWENIASKRFEQLKNNEENINRHFISIYGLSNDLSESVDDENITVRLADLQRDIRSFISYAVGCMFGRYSLDVPGLIYAGGEWDASKYKSFQADVDAIIPICDDEYFEDDIVNRFVKFVEVVYGKDTLDENLKFIADALGGNGTSREAIRNYFINDFYADHVKIYQKRPIYWLFDSGKKNGFKCLIYMHRYQSDTIARIRTDYVHEQQARYRTAIEEIEKRLDTVSQSEKVKLTKKLNSLRDQDEELHAYEEKIHHLADQMISIDLDDGVKHNYDLFKDVLAKIK